MGKMSMKSEEAGKPGRTGLEKTPDRKKSVSEYGAAHPHDSDERGLDPHELCDLRGFYLAPEKSPRHSETDLSIWAQVRFRSGG